MARSTEWRGFRAYLTKPHDGDSFWVMCDSGFNGRAEPELRLVDVHAPELRAMRLPPMFQPGGSETTAFVNDWMEHAKAVDPLRPRRWYLWVETILTSAYEPEQRQTFTRYLAKVWLYGQRPTGDRPTIEALTLNAALTLYLSGHPEWPPGE